MQVSFSETFNIVSADAVISAVPVIASHEVAWLGDYAMATADNAATIVVALWRVWNDSQEQRLFRMSFGNWREAARRLQELEG